MTAPIERRRLSIDVLRSVAICLMIVVHFVENLSGARGAVPATAGAWWLPTGFAAPLFTFLVGVNYRGWVEHRRRAGLTSESISKASVRRGLFLVGLGFVFNVVVWLPEDTFNWDVLTFVGLSLLLLDVARRMPPSATALTVVTVLAISPVLRAAADYPSFWQTGFFEPDQTFSDVVIGCLVTGYFPLCPWLVFPLTGYLLAPALIGEPAIGHPGSGGREPLSSGPRVIVSALAGSAVAFLLIRTWLPAGFTIGTASGWTMFPASTAYVTGSLALAIGSLALLHPWLDAAPAHGRRGRMARWLGPFSRHSLSIYVLHHVVHVWPMWLAGLAAGGEVTAYWQQATSPTTALALAAGCILACGLWAWCTDRSGGPSLERLMRWLCD